METVQKLNNHHLRHFYTFIIIQDDIEIANRSRMQDACHM